MHVHIYFIISNNGCFFIVFIFCVGLLDLQVDLATETKLNQMFCQTMPNVPPGLSVKIKAIGAKIEEKVGES